MGLAARNEKHVPRRQLDLLVRCRTRIDRHAVGQLDGMRYHCFPKAPSFPAVNLHGEDIIDVQCGLNAPPYEEAARYAFTLVYSPISRSTAAAS